MKRGEYVGVNQVPGSRLQIVRIVRRDFSKIRRRIFHDRWPPTNHLVKNLMAAIFKMRFTTILFIYLSLLIILNQFSFLFFRPLKFETGTRMKFYAPPRPQKIFMRKKCDEYELTFKGNLVSDNDDGDDDDDGDGKDPWGKESEKMNQNAVECGRLKIIQTFLESQKLLFAMDKVSGSQTVLRVTLTVKADTRACTSQNINENLQLNTENKGVDKSLFTVIGLLTK